MTSYIMAEYGAGYIRLNIEGQYLQDRLNAKIVKEIMHRFPFHGVIFSKLVLMTLSLAIGPPKLSPFAILGLIKHIFKRKVMNIMLTQ